MMFIIDNIMPTFVKRKMLESKGLSGQYFEFRYLDSKFRLPKIMRRIDVKYLLGQALENQLNSKIFGGMTMVKHMHEVHLIQSRVEAEEGGQVPELDLGRFQYGIPLEFRVTLTKTGKS